jgi:hypothetical protein
MGRTIGAAVGALIVMLFFASLAARAHTVSAAESTVSATTQSRATEKPAAEVASAQAMQHAH